MKKIPTRRVSNAFMIGLFVMVSSLVLIGAVIWLGANKFFKDNTYYVTYFGNSVQGLEIGSPVKYQGVPVGTVNKIGLAPDGKLVEVTLQINESSNIRISDSMRIKSEFAGVAGGKFLQLHFPSSSSLYNIYPRLSFKPPYKVIPSAPSGFDEIESIAKDLLKNMTQFDVGGLSDGAINFLDATSQFMRNKDLFEAIKYVNESANSLASILSKIDESNMMANVNSATNKLNQSSEQLLNFSTSLNKKINEIELNKQLEHIVEKYDLVMNNLNKNINGLSAQSTNLLLSVNELMDNLKTTMKELKKSLRAVNDNPSAIFLSKPPKEEK